MKKYVIILLVSISSILITSCEDYLEPTSSSVYTEDMVFSNLDFAEKAVNGIYERLVQDVLYNYSAPWYKMDNDIEFINGINSSGTNAISHLAQTENTQSLNTAWDAYFKGIERANICIKNLPESPMWNDEDDADDAKRLYGEAIALRAFMYFDCIKYWGDVPFTTEPQNEEDLFSYKTDRDSIYEYLIQDLKDVEEYVPWMSDEGTTTRITRGFVKGLRARMALAYAGYSLRNVTFETRRGRYWEDYYKIANQECKELIESGKHSLNPNYEGVFKNLHAYTKDLEYGEILFELGMPKLYGGRALALLVGLYSYSDVVGDCWGLAKTSPAYFYSFDNNDSRRNTTIEFYSVYQKQTIVSANYLYICKWRREWLDPIMGGTLKGNQRVGVNWPMMRYSDVLLMYAETENEINNGPTQAAKDALTLVRQRAFDEAYWSTNVAEYVESVSGSKDDFFNALVDERAWEFGGEFIRKDDLIRWNLLGTKITEMKENTMKVINGELYSDKLSNYLFWKYPDGGTEISILNPDYVMADAAPEGYTRAIWYPILSESRIASVQEWLDLVANGYDPAKNNHLLHIHSSIISQSRGTLSNDQIPE